MRSISCDVLVIGGGCAALRAAIAAKESAPGLKVVLAVKGKLGKSGVTANAYSDRMAFHAALDYTEPAGDAWRYHADDIYRIGGMVSDGSLAEVLAKGGKEAFEYLDGLGVPFVKKNGHSRPVRHGRLGIREGLLYRAEDGRRHRRRPFAPVPDPGHRRIRIYGDAQAGRQGGDG